MTYYLILNTFDLIKTLPCGVIGNTPDFDSGILGSSPSEAV